MTTPQALLIADAIVARLKAANVSNGAIFHVIPDLTADSGVVVTCELSKPVRGAIKGHPVDWDTTVKFDCGSRFGVNNQRPHEACVLLAGVAYAALFADETLGGKCDGLLPGAVSWDYTDQEKQMAVCTFRLTAQHQTPYGAI